MLSFNYMVGMGAGNIKTVGFSQMMIMFILVVSACFRDKIEGIINFLKFSDKFALVLR